MPVIRKVKVLTGKLKREAKKRGLSPDDLVIVDGDILEKIVGDPVSFLLERAKKVPNDKKETLKHLGNG